MASRYEVRQKALEAIGFVSYKAYLASETWQAVKGRILERDGCCKACRNPAYTAHHITYSEAVLLGNDDSQLVAICKGCHRFVEFHNDKKLTYTTDIFTRLARRMVRKGGGASTKKARKALRPRCRCCERQYRALGRNDICMGCYKSGRALKFVQNASA